MKIMIKKNLIFIFLLSMLAVYVNFTFSFKIYPMLQYVIYYLIMCIYIFKNAYRIKKMFRWKNERKKYFVGAIIIFAILFISSLIIPFLYNTRDFSFINILLSCVRQSIGQIFILLIIDKKISTDNLKMTYINITINSGIIYILCTSLMLIFPGIRTLWSSIIYISEYNKALIGISYYESRFGLAGFSGFECTVYCTFFLILQLYIICNQVMRCNKVNIKQYLKVGVLFIGNLYYGRSGAVASIIFILIAVIYLSIIYGKIGVLMKISILTAIFIGGIDVLKNYSSTINTVYIWAITPIINFLNTGEFGVASYNSLMQMYEKFAPSFSTLLWGDGYYTNPITGYYYMNVDVGYMRMIYFYGIFNTILCYIMMIFLILSIEYNFSKYAKKMRYLMLLLFIGIIFIFEMKGLVFYRLVGFFVSLSLANTKKLIEIKK